MNLARLQAHFRGEILTPASAGYDAARKIWNGMIDRRPAAIARCIGPSDVAAAVRFAADEGLYPAVRGGGHNVAGLAMLDGGFVIDVSPMKDIVVESAEHTAKAQAGLTWGEFDRATPGARTRHHRRPHLHNRHRRFDPGRRCWVADAALRAGVRQHAGVRRCYRLRRDRSGFDERAPRLVLGAQGRRGNFGVVTSISYRLYRITTIISGMILHPLAAAGDVLRFYRDFVSSGLPDELIVYAAAITTPDGTPVIALLPAYSGDDLEEGERLIAPLRQFGSPLADLVATTPYLALQQMLDAAAPFGQRSYWKSGFLRELPDTAKEVLRRVLLDSFP